MLDLSRRGFLSGLGPLLVAARAIVRASSIMPVKAMPELAALDALREHEFVLRTSLPTAEWRQINMGVPGTTVDNGKVFMNGEWVSFDEPRGIIRNNRTMREARIERIKQCLARASCTGPWSLS
jgi:hypothetical protein